MSGDTSTAQMHEVGWFCLKIFIIYHNLHFLFLNSHKGEVYINIKLKCFQCQNISKLLHDEINKNPIFIVKLQNEIHIFDSQYLQLCKKFVLELSSSGILIYYKASFNNPKCESVLHTLHVLIIVLQVKFSLSKHY